MNIKEWWENKSIGMKFMYGLFIVLFIITNIIFIYGKTKINSGLRIDDAYIKVIEPCQQEINDVYVSKMLEFADECGGAQQFFRLNNQQNKLLGVTLWCKNTSKAFTFYYSDKWLSDNYDR